jgi:hypothetical protein
MHHPRAVPLVSVACGGGWRRMMGIEPTGRSLSTVPDWF